MKYEMILGLETHVELSTKTKIFCGCTTAFGGEPNTHCCPVCIGLPGTLPVLNRVVVEYAVKAGLATGCKINLKSKMDRKNYVYPDLPKAYQISQYDMPLCENGSIKLSSGRNIGITRIHIEEDAGKLIHRQGNVYIDYNRSGVPLIEIVSEPDLHSVDEAVEYMEKIQLLMKYIGVSDCRMQEGSLRCDVNISLRPKGQKEFGTRTEIKNMNSFTFMAKAIEYECERQADILNSGGKVIQETRKYNVETGCTESMRGKEDAQDYRYFRDPDLVTINLTPEEISRIGDTLPELPDKRRQRYVDIGIPESDATLIIKHKNVADYFEAAIKDVKNPRTVANLILGPIFRTLSTDSAKEGFQVLVSASNLNELVLLIENKGLSIQQAREALEKMLKTGLSAGEYISTEDLIKIDDLTLTMLCRDAVKQNPDAVSQYLAGKEKAVGAVIGCVMKLSKGRADAEKTRQIIDSIIK